MNKSIEDLKVRKPWRHAILTIEKILTITEIWPTKDRNIFRKLKIAFSILAVILFDISILMELRNLMLAQDYEALSTHLATLGLYIGYTIKIIIFHFNKNGFKQLLAIMDLAIFDDRSLEMQKHKDKCISVSNGIAVFYVSCVAISIFLYLNRPLYSDYYLPISFSYELNSIAYILVLTWQCYCCYYLVMIGISFDLINIGLINIATAQLDVLGEAVATFKQKNPKCLSMDEYAFLRKCANRHQVIIRFVDRIEEVFSYIFLTQCLASVTSICNGAFQLTHTDKLLSVNFMFNCCFAFDVLFEIGICCWFAGLLTIKSLEMADACYNYYWLNSTTQTKTLLLIILRRSQKPLYITAGKFFRLSMAAFLSILKTAYSYFALMQSLYDKNNDEI